MTPHVLVTGGSGTRQVAARLRDRGASVRILPRRVNADTDGIDLVRGDRSDGTGLHAAVAGVDTIGQAARAA